MNYAGIDWADKQHEVCIMSADGRVLSELSISHDWEGFEQLQAVLIELGEVEINIERPNGLLVDWLHTQGWPVYVMPPVVVNRRRVRPTKSDRGDAYLLANLLRQRDEECRALIVHSPQAEELKQLVRGYDQLQREQVRLSGQLCDLLKLYYPVAVDLFSKLHQPLTLAFLQAYPAPHAARAVSREQLVAFFTQQRYRWMQRVDGIYEKLQTPAPTARLEQGYVQHMLALVALLQTLYQQLSILKRQIVALFDSHPEADWWRAIPGCGQLTAPRLLARIGDNLERFPSYRVLQAHAGTVPVTRSSSKSKFVSFRLNCDRSLRRAVTDLARNSVRKSGWAKSYFYDQLARGHSKQRAYRALANRWLRILWTIRQRGELYDEARHVANRARWGLAPSPNLKSTAQELDLIKTSTPNIRQKFCVCS